MKKCFVLVALLCVLAVSGCVSQVEDEGSLPPTDASAAPSGDVVSSIASSVEPSLEVSPLPEPMSYVEFFSEYREFKECYDSMAFPTTQHIFISGFLNSAYGYNDQTLIDGYLYKRTEAGEFQLLIEEPVSHMTTVGNRIYVSQQNCIYSLDANAQNQELVLESASDITYFVANETLIFYVANDMI